jgi:endonuclease III
MRDLVETLGAFYGPQAPPPRDLFGFVVWEILSARTLPSRRDLGWTALRRMPALTPDAMFRTARADLQAALAMLPSRDERIDDLKAASGHLRRRRDLDQVLAGPLRGALSALAEVPALSAAARVRALIFVGGHAVAPIDDGVLRAVARLDGLADPRPRALRRLARGRLTSGCGQQLDLLRQATVMLAHHAAHACADPMPHCGVCPLAARCRSAG